MDENDDGNEESQTNVKLDIFTICLGGMLVKKRHLTERRPTPQLSRPPHVSAELNISNSALQPHIHQRLRIPSSTMLIPRSEAMSGHKPHKRIIFYHQTQYRDDRYISILPALNPSSGVTHVIVAAIHLNAPDNITLNDDLYNSSKFIPLWDEVRQLQAAGIKVLGMLGGAAQGSYTKLDGSLEGFHRWYQPLRKMIKWAGFDGLDLDIEEAMSLGGVVRLIDHLKTDFGQSFLVTLAPVAPALLNRQNLGGFNIEELEKGLGSRIAWYNTQFYCGWGDMSKTHDYDTIIARGWPQEKVVIGLVTNPANCSGHVSDSKLKACLKELVGRYPRIGGVMGWEYWNAVTEESPDVGTPWKWAEMINDILNPKSKGE